MPNVRAANRRTSNNSVAGADATYAQDKRYAQDAQHDKASGDILNALRAQLSHAKRLGAMDGELPRLEDNMSGADVTNAQTRLNQILDQRTGGKWSKLSPEQQKAFDPAKPQADAKPARPALTEISTSTPKNAPPLRDITAQSSPMTVAPGPVGQTRGPGSVGTQLVDHALDPASYTPKMDHGTATVDAAALQNSAAESSMTGNPALDGLVHNGAGYSAHAGATGGPHGISERDVAFTPSAHQSMSLETKGQWDNWNPQQRADYLRARGTSQPQGTVVDSGVTSKMNPQGFITKTSQTPTGNVVSGMSPAEMRQTELQYTPADNGMPAQGSVKYVTPAAKPAVSTPPVTARQGSGTPTPTTGTGATTAGKPTPPTNSSLDDLVKHTGDIFALAALSGNKTAQKQLQISNPAPNKELSGAGGAPVQTSTPDARPTIKTPVAPSVPASNTVAGVPIVSGVAPGMTAAQPERPPMTSVAPVAQASASQPAAPQPTVQINPKQPTAPQPSVEINPPQSTPSPTVQTNGNTGPIVQTNGKRDPFLRF